MSKYHRGVISDDPAKLLEAGSRISFKSMLYRPIAAPCAGDLLEWTHFGNALLAVGFVSDDALSVEGSAVMIGPGLALAARHVIEPWLERLMASEVTPLVCAITDFGLQFWLLTQIIIDGTDVVILRLDLGSELPPNNEFSTATLTTRIPTVGELVQIAGFRSHSASLISENYAEILGEVRVGIGRVTAVYLIGRDRVMLPNLCLEIDCQTLGGMSGGPAFDSNGRLVGVLATSFEHETGPSYVSLAWPVFNNKIESSWLTGLMELPTTIIECARKGLVWIDRPDALTVVGDHKLQLKRWN